MTVGKTVFRCKILIESPYLRELVKKKKNRKNWSVKSCLESESLQIQCDFGVPGRDLGWFQTTSCHHILRSDDENFSFPNNQKKKLVS